MKTFKVTVEAGCVGAAYVRQETRESFARQYAMSMFEKEVSPRRAQDAAVTMVEVLDEPITRKTMQRIKQGQLDRSLAVENAKTEGECHIRKRQFSEYQAEYGDIIDLWHECRRKAIPFNQYSPMTDDDIEASAMKCFNAILEERQREAHEAQAGYEQDGDMIKQQEAAQADRDDKALVELLEQGYSIVLGTRLWLVLKGELIRGLDVHEIEALNRLESRGVIEHTILKRSM